MNDSINSNLCWYKKHVLIDMLCQDIIVLFEESMDTQNEMIIPKHSKKWEKIELILYKELLNYIYKYKNNLIIQSVQQDERKNLIIQNLNKELYVKRFKIRKYVNNTNEILFVKPPPNDPNRYNILKFVFSLHLFSFKTPALRAVMSGEGDTDCASSMRNGVKTNNCEIIIENDTILLESGNLLIFPNDFIYKIKIPITETQYIIYGELAYIQKH
jgi:hypothetical protein